MHYAIESDTKARDAIHAFIGLCSPVTWCLVFALYSGVSNHAYWASQERAAMVMAVFVLGPYVLPWLLYFLQPLVLPFWLWAMQWWQAAVGLWYRWWVCKFLYTYVLCTYVNIVFINGHLRERVQKNARWVLYVLKNGKDRWIEKEKLKVKAEYMGMVAFRTEKNCTARLETHEKVCGQVLTLQSEKTALQSEKTVLLDEIKWLKKHHEAKLQEQCTKHQAEAQILCAKHEAEKQTLHAQYAKLDRTLQDERRRYSELEKKRPAVLEAKLAEIEAELTRTRAKIEQFKREMAKSNETIASLNKTLEQRSDAPKKEDLPADMLQEEVLELKAELKKMQEKRGDFYLNSCAKQVLKKFVKMNHFKIYINRLAGSMKVYDFCLEFIVNDYMKLDVAHMTLFKDSMKGVSSDVVEHCIVYAFGVESETMVKSMLEVLFGEGTVLNRKNLNKAYRQIHPDKAGDGNPFYVLINQCLFDKCRSYQDKAWPK
jgi:hypothetical protein